MVLRSEISQRMEDKLKRLYPESKALDMDRKYTAKNVLDPSSMIDVREWAKKPNKYDLKGFDTKSGQEPSKKQVMKKLSRMLVGNSGEEALQDEPERYVEPKFEAGKLIEHNKDDIKDFKSFVETVEKSWKHDPSLINLLSNIKNEESLRNMFNDSTIQNYVFNNTKSDMVGFVMKKFGVEQVRASRVVNSLSNDLRGKLYHKTTLKNAPRLKRIRNKLPTARWTVQETNLLKANKHLPAEKMSKLFNDLTAYKRSRTAIVKRRMELGDKDYLR